MKNLLIFLFGVSVGAGGTFVWLHKDIKKQLEEAKIAAMEEVRQAENPPFDVSENDENKEENKPEALKKSTKTAYHKVVESVKTGDTTAVNDVFREPVMVPVVPRDDDYFNDDDGYFVDGDETNGGVYEIDKDEFMNNDTYEQERLVYYRGDHIMATEEGTIIRNPAILVGSTWQNCVGNYVNNTAFIRNSKMLKDYEIFCEDGLYEDEYGVEYNYKED